MGNSNSTPNAPSAPTHLATFTSSHSLLESIETHHTFSVSPFDHSTFVSVTKAYTTSSPYKSTPTRTGEYCSWDWKEETSYCTTWSFTVDVPTPFTFPTPAPTGGYETSEVSFSSFGYTCTDLLCIDSVASKYGFSLCLATATPTTKTLSWPQEFTTNDWPTIAPTCDPELDWWCVSPTSEFSTLTDDWPTGVLPTLTLEWPTARATSSDYEETETPSTSSTTTESCEYANDCLTPVRRTSSRTTSTSKHSYSYRSTTSSTSARHATTSTTSECDFWFEDCTPGVPIDPTTSTTSECYPWFEDCTPAATIEPTIWDSPDSWSGHTSSTTIKPRPHWSAETKKESPTVS